MIRAGQLRHLLLIEREVVSGRTGRGLPVESWQTLYAGVWGKVEALAGTQLEVSRQLVATATHKVTIRYHAGVAAQMRLTAQGGQYGGRHLVVGHVGDGDGKKHDMILTCTEQQSGAT